MHAGSWKSSVMFLVWLFPVALTYAQGPGAKAAALAAVAAEWDSLPHQDLAADSQALLNFAKGRAEFSAAGIVSGSTSVWARFTDGRTVVIANNVLDPAPPGPLSASAQRRASSVETASSTAQRIPALTTAVDSPQELPRSNQARLIHTISGWATAVPDVQPWLTDAGYNVINDPGTVANLRQVQGDGVLYFEGHGGQWEDSTPAGAIRFAVWTSDSLDLFGEDNDPVMKDDLDNGRVVYMLGEQNIDPITLKAQVGFHYGITAGFVTKYWSFGPNSFVFLTVCESFTVDSADFQIAVLAKGASVYAGWTGDAGVIEAVRSARLVFDRLLGANRDRDPSILESGFKQRPFDYVSVQTDLPLHNLGRYGQASLLFTPYITGPSFGLLAPSISYLGMIEQNQQLMILGTFGEDPRLTNDTALVTVGGTAVNGGPEVDGGTPVDIVSWDPGVIVVQLNLSGGGSAGNVQVTARGHRSNVAQLTDWRGDRFTFTSTGPGSGQQQQMYNFHFRADVRKWRSVIHDPPTEPAGLAVFSANDSTGTFSSSGTGAVGDISYSWTGSGALVNYFYPGATDNWLGIAGIVTRSTQIMFNADVISDKGLSCTVCSSSGCDTSQASVRGPSQYIASAPFSFALDPTTAQIEANSFPYQAPPDASQPCTPPGSSNGKFTWGTMPPSPNTAPDPNSAR